MRIADTRAPLSHSRTRSAPSRHLFELDARDLTVSPRTGQMPTFTRAGSGSYVDSRGNVRVAPYGMPRFTVAGGRVGLLMERAATNYVKASEDLASETYWARSFGATVAAISGPGIAGYRVTDARADAHSTISQAVVMPAAWWTLSLHWRAGTAPSSYVSLGAAIVAAIAAGEDGAPVVTTSAGRYLGAERRADGWWRVLLGSTASQGSGAAGLNIGAARDLGGSTALQGYVDMTAVQVEAVPTPSSYVRSVGATQGTRAADRLSYPLGWLPRDLTIYAEWARPAWVGIAAPSGHRTAVSVGGDSSFVGCKSGTAGLVGAYGVGDGVAAVETAYPAGALGDTVRSAARFSSVASALAVEVEVEGAASAASGPVGGVLGAYGLPTIGVGSHDGGAGNEFDGLLYRVRVRAGAWGVTQMIGGGG